jgi:uncharacterized protein (TIGR04255 family)
MEPAIPETVAILLDIDVYMLEDLPNTVTALEQKLEDLRNLKNKIFEICITDKARESFR